MSKILKKSEIEQLSTKLADEMAKDVWAKQIRPHKHAELIKAFADGHEIEIRIFDTNTDKWLLWHNCDLFTLSQAEKFPDTYLQLRIKPD